MRKLLAMIMLTILLVTTVGFAEVAQHSPALTAAPEGSFAQLPALVSNPIGFSVNLTNLPDDYDVPMGTYFNGVTLTILAVEPTFGDYPVQFEDQAKLWARVLIGKTDSFDGIQGMMPLAGLRLTSNQDESSLPTGKLQDKAVLFSNNGLDDATMGEFPAGTAFEVLGLLKDWLHVRIGEQTGFINQDLAKIDEASLSAVMSAMPLDFDQIQPGFQARYDEYMTKLMKLYEDHGDSNHWPLEVSAQASQLAASYGYVFSEVVNLMPGDKDLSQDQVMDLAKQYAHEAYGYDPTAWNSISLAFYHQPGNEEEPTWKASLWSGDGTRDVKIWMNRQGELIHSLSYEDMFTVNEGDVFDDYAQPMEDTLEYYLWGRTAEPKADEIQLETAQEMAWAVFKEQTGETNTALFQAETTFRTNDEGDRRWWLVLFTRAYDETISTYYYVALVMPEGNPVFHSDLTIYQEDTYWAERMMELFRLEEERGLMHTWTLEQKAAWEPEYFGLPEAEEVTLEQAEKIADDEVLKAYDLKPEDLKDFEKGTFFVTSPQRQWQVVFLYEGEQTDEGIPGYTVITNAKDGTVEHIFGDEHTD